MEKRIEQLENAVSRPIEGQKWYDRIEIGGLIVGLPAAVVSYFVTYSAVERYQKELKAKLARQKEKLALKKQYVEKLRGKLPIRKIAMLQSTELKFKRRILKKIQEEEQSRFVTQ